MSDSTYRGKQAPTLTTLYWRDGFTASPACLAVPVRGHEKVLASGQVGVLAGGQL